MVFENTATGLQTLLPLTPAVTRKRLTKGMPSILYANSQIRSEAMPIFYATTTFMFHPTDALAPWLAELQPAFRTAIAHVCYVPRSMPLWESDARTASGLDEIATSLSAVELPRGVYNIMRSSSRSRAEYVVWPKGQWLADHRPKAGTYRRFKLCND